MALRKSYAGKVIQQVSEKILEDGTIIRESRPVCEPTRHVDMHPLEETAMRAHWAIHDVKSKILAKPTREEEHEWLIEYGPAYVKEARLKWQESYDALLPEIQLAEKAHQDAHAEWIKHAERAHANGFDPDTCPDARDMPLPEETK